MDQRKIFELLKDNDVPLPDPLLRIVAEYAIDVSKYLSPAVAYSQEHDEAELRKAMTPDQDFVYSSSLSSAVNSGCFRTVKFLLDMEHPEKLPDAVKKAFEEAIDGNQRGIAMMIVDEYKMKPEEFNHLPRIRRMGEPALGPSALIQAIDKNDMQMCELLISKGADVDFYPDQDLYRDLYRHFHFATYPLVYAAEKAATPEAKEIVTLLFRQSKCWGQLSEHQKATVEPCLIEEQEKRAELGDLKRRISEALDKGKESKKDERIEAIKEAVNKAPNILTIKRIIQNQRELFDNKHHPISKNILAEKWQTPKNLKNKDKAGTYFRTMVNVQMVIDSPMRNKQTAASNKRLSK